MKFVLIASGLMFALLFAGAVLVAMHPKVDALCSG